VEIRDQLRRLTLACAFWVAAASLIVPSLASGASEIAVTHDGSKVVATGFGGLTVFTRSGATGSLSEPTAGPAGQGSGCAYCRGLAVSDDGRFAYLTDSSGNAIRQLSFTGGNNLSLDAVYENHVSGISGLKRPLGVAITPDQKSLYVQTEEGALVAFSRDSLTGDLTFLHEYPLTGNAGREVVVSRDNAFVYASTPNGGFGPVNRFTRDTGTGELSGLTAEGNASQPRAFAISPDDRYLYVGGEQDIVVYERDLGTGALTEVQRLVDGVGGVTGLVPADSLAISGDGESLYAVSAGENSLVSFVRDPATGRLTYLTSQFQSVGGITGLTKAIQVSLSPDGKSIYVASETEGVTVFSRSSASSAPTFVEVVNPTFVVTLPEPASGGGGNSTGGGGGSNGGSVSTGLAFNGSESVSIDDGALYTDSPDVTLTVRAPGNATAVRVSNDGGFDKASDLGVAPSHHYNWTLESSGPERLPKTVYVRFVGPGGPSPLNFTDDIILDQTPPAFEGLSVTPVAATSVSAVAPRKQPGARVLVKAKAADKTSGVGGIQITNSKKKPGKTLKFKSRVTFSSTGPRVFARVRDRAGNFSRWKSATVR
jgi:6-phosphogluconolactonase (cycloisomerase 2 family)